MGFDKDSAMKRNLPIVSGITAIDLPGKTIFAQANEVIYNSNANHSLLSEFQLREHGVTLDTVPNRHGGKQAMTLENVAVPLSMKDCMMYFTHRHPTTAKLASINERPEQLYHLTQDNVPWNPRNFADDKGKHCPSIVAKLNTEDDEVPTAPPHTSHVDNAIGTELNWKVPDQVSRGVPVIYHKMPVIYHIS